MPIIRYTVRKKQYEWDLIEQEVKRRAKPTGRLDYNGGKHLSVKTRMLNKYCSDKLKDLVANLPDGTASAKLNIEIRQKQFRMNVSEAAEKALVAEAARRGITLGELIDALVWQNIETR